MNYGASADAVGWETRPALRQWTLSVGKESSTIHWSRSEIMAKIAPVIILSTPYIRRTSRVSAEVCRDQAQEYFMLTANDVDQRTIIVRSAQTARLLSKLLRTPCDGCTTTARAANVQPGDNQKEYWIYECEHAMVAARGGPIIKKHPPLRKPLLEGRGISLVTTLQECWNVQSKGSASQLTRGENRAAMRIMRRNESRRASFCFLSGDSY